MRYHQDWSQRRWVGENHVIEQSRVILVLIRKHGYNIFVNIINHTIACIEYNIKHHLLRLLKNSYFLWNNLPFEPFLFFSLINFSIFILIFNYIHMGWYPKQGSCDNFFGCQWYLEKLWRKFLGVSGREFRDCDNWGRRAYPKCAWWCSMSRSSELHKKEQASWESTFLTSYSLSENAMWQATFKTSCCAMSAMMDHILKLWVKISVLSLICFKSVLWSEHIEK